MGSSAICSVVAVVHHHPRPELIPAPLSLTTVVMVADAQVRPTRPAVAAPRIPTVVMGATDATEIRFGTAFAAGLKEMAVAGVAVEAVAVAAVEVRGALITAPALRTRITGPRSMAASQGRVALGSSPIRLPRPCLGLYR